MPLSLLAHHEELHVVHLASRHGQSRDIDDKAVASTGERDVARLRVTNSASTNVHR
jgi:hypothetical protein